MTNVTLLNSFQSFRVYASVPQRSGSRRKRSRRSSRYGFWYCALKTFARKSSNIYCLCNVFEWYTYILLDVLVCTIVVYFHELCRILTSLTTSKYIKSWTNVWRPNTIKHCLVTKHADVEVSGQTVKPCLIKHRSNNWYKPLSKRGTHARINYVWYAAVQTNKTSPIKHENKKLF